MFLELRFQVWVRFGLKTEMNKRIKGISVDKNTQTARSSKDKKNDKKKKKRQKNVVFVRKRPNNLFG